jgi:hypothetical protein
VNVDDQGAQDLRAGESRSSCGILQRETVIAYVECPSDAYSTKKLKYERNSHMLDYESVILLLIRKWSSIGNVLSHCFSFD